jgi:hypothetical protein
MVSYKMKEAANDAIENSLIIEGVQHQFITILVNTFKGLSCYLTCQNCSLTLA